MPKKSNTKRSDGRYAVQVYLGMTDGKRKYKTVYGATQKEANQKADEIKVIMNKGVDIARSSDTFEVWSQRWLTYMKNVTSESQLRVYKNRISFFAETLGGYPVNRIELYQIQDIINKLALKNPYTNKPTAKKTIVGYIGTINQFYSYLLLNRIVDFSPAKGLSLPINSPQKQRRALTSEEQQWITDTPHRAQLPAMLAMLAGLRRGEITALTWSDVDLENKSIRIDKSYDFKNKKMKLPKTKSGKRTVAIPDKLCDYLKNCDKSNSLVCPNTIGTMMTEPAWQRLWDYYLNALNKKYGDFTKHNKEMESLKQKYIKEGKPLSKLPKALPMVIEPFSIHCLRHTYATILYDAGVDVLTAKKLLGHSDVKTTLSIYTHLSEENEKLNVDKLNDFISNK